MNPLPAEAGLGPNRQPSLPPISAGGILAEPMSVDGSPASTTPRRAFDMLAGFLHNVPFNFQPNTRVAPASLPVEVRANICSLLGHLGRQGVVVNREQDVHVLRDRTKEYMEALARDSGSDGQNKTAAAAKRALEAWAKV